MLTPGFLTKVGSIRVEKMPVRDFGDVDLSKAPVGVGHTTEGSFESALQKFQSVDAPHFLVGADRTGKVRICQLVALGRTAGRAGAPFGNGRDEPVGTRPDRAGGVLEEIRVAAGSGRARRVHAVGRGLA